MFETVIFAGGGNRSFWQAGFWHEAGRQLPVPKRVLAVSAGAYVAAGVFSGRMQGLLDSASDAFSGNRRNFYPLRLLRLQRPFPHPPIYRNCLARNLDATALEMLRSAPPIHVLTATPSEKLPLALGLTLSALHYLVDKFVRKPLHSSAGRRLGFRPAWHRMQDCGSSEALIDLICASSSVAPVFPVLRIAGLVALDGGYVDNNGLPQPGEFPEVLGRTLVLLTRRHAQLPSTDMLRYVQPSAKLPVANFDATAAQGVRDAYAAGRRDALAFLAEL